MSSVPRDPSAYSPDTHVKQRVKYRSDPCLEWDHIADVIESGEIEEARYDRTTFTAWHTIAGKGHSVRVVTTPEREIVSAYCPCHKDDMRDCHELDPANGFITATHE